MLSSIEHPPHYTLTNTYTGICDNTDNTRVDGLNWINEVAEEVQIFVGHSQSILIHEIAKL